MTFGSGINGCLGFGNCDDVQKYVFRALNLDWNSLKSLCRENNLLFVSPSLPLFLSPSLLSPN